MPKGEADEKAPAVGYALPTPWRMAHCNVCGRLVPCVEYRPNEGIISRHTRRWLWTDIVCDGSGDMIVWELASAAIAQPGMK